MGFSLIGTDGKEIAFRNVIELRREIGFLNHDEIRTFLDSTLFKPFFEEGLKA